jgi:hypothetical protein
MNKGPVLGVCFAAISMLAGCLIVGDDEDGLGGFGGSTSNGGAPGTGGFGGETTNGGAPGTGGGGFCIFNPEDACDATQEADCLCIGCSDLCVDGDGNQVSDCVCAACSQDEVCNTNCVDDGNCEPAREGCACADCSEHPECF